MTSGTQSGVFSPPKTPTPVNTSRRANLKQLGDIKTSTASAGPRNKTNLGGPKADGESGLAINNGYGSTNGFPGTPSSSTLARSLNPNNSVTEEGEISDANPDSSFKNTYPPGVKRSSKDILSNSCREIKQPK
ncbi:hypothetical protein PCASD_05038 [Puccinia coronata f. sp. avenae]|nr:hypothetical protein PCASD_05038 [Puccinia coronata f. sp. avenae]